MQVPPQIAFENFDPPPAVRARVERELDKLDALFAGLISAHVVVRAPGRHRVQGDLYDVSIHLTLPQGRAVAVTRHPPERQAHQDVLVAIRDAFDAARRQLQDAVREMRGQIKAHAGAPLATVKALIGAQDHGFLTTDDGRELYFHRNSVVDGDFDRLSVGDRVAFHEQRARKGPQASTVRPLGKHALL
ncbi:hypothetical protein CCR85_12360 [Rhodothalassium salexigens]|uniref:HPF/RaiA family ribosome-associated protein n=1 Tax=Rhodothalassium salexigens TaxID=1086 RepID=UPI001912EB08|nr:HPF/RaiA family ribosome-associated protein [Rhodothalassium salexigens]MBK5912283.1 hypothetical protein [Rhodothalassium salexigens]MBK5920295.1 hypothetical protein [Rhodothalassium salexigens]